MKESFETPESIDAEQLLADIQKMREFAVTSAERNDMWTNLTYKWVQSFRKKLHEKYGSETRFHQEVPVYQALVGGSIEEEVTITDDARNFILKEVLDAYTEFKEKMGSV